MNETEYAMEKELILNHAAALSRTVRTLQLQNDFINQIPAPDKIDPAELGIRYAYLYKSLDNLFELNHHLIDDTDSVAAYLYNFVDETEEVVQETEEY